MKRWIAAPLSKKARRTADSPDGAVRLSKRIRGPNQLLRRAEILDRALRRWPNNTPLIQERAAVTIEAMEYASAETLLLKARSIDGDDSRTLEALGLLYLAWNRLADAETMLLEARRLAPRNTSVLRALAALYQHLAKRLSRVVASGGRKAKRT